MEIVFWVIVTIIVLAVVYVFRKRQAALGRKPRSDVAPDTKEHGIDLQARRKLYDDAT